MTTMTPVQSRYLALGLFVVVASVVIAVFSWPWMATYSTQQAELEHKQKQIGIYRQLSASEGAMKQELTLLQRRNPTAAFYVAGETQALASARMQQYVKQIVDQQGGELISTQVVKKDDDGVGNKARLNVHLRSDMGSSSRILYMLESGKPLLFLDNLSISARLVRGTTVGAAPLVSLDMSFDVTGYLQEGA